MIDRLFVYGFLAAVFFAAVWVLMFGLQEWTNLPDAVKRLGPF